MQGEIYYREQVNEDSQNHTCRTTCDCAKEMNALLNSNVEASTSRAVTDPGLSSSTRSK